MSSAAGSSSARAVASRLMEMADVIAEIDDWMFRSARKDGVSGSVGAHVRHVLDHVTALTEAREGVVDYDSRQRGTLVEHHRVIAITELQRVALRLFALPQDAEQREVSLSAVITPDGARVGARSSVGRELVFVLSHTVHHQAIVALLLASAGWRVPERFGIAPSTPSVQPCALSV